MSELGNKHECLGCGTKFYDLGRNELICPKCGENQKELAAAEEGAANSPGPVSKKPAKKAKKAQAAEKKDTESEDESPDEESADEDEE